MGLGSIYNIPETHTFAYVLLKIGLGYNSMCVYYSGGMSICSAEGEWDCFSYRKAIPW